MFTPGPTSFTNPSWVPWPSAGWFPSLLEPGDRWSLSADGRGYSFAGATVTVRGPQGTVLPVTVHSPEYGYANDTLVWEMGTLPFPGPGEVHTYTVTVSGISKDATTGLSTTYHFRMYTPPPPCGGSPVSGRQLNLDVNCDCG